MVKKKYLKPEENPNLYQTHCLGKVQHASESAALAVLDLAKHDPELIGEYRRPDLLEAYLCRFSPREQPHWHLGNMAIAW